MAKNSYVNANLISTYDTFANWLVRTNQITFDMGNFVVTVNNSATADVTTGNGYVNGFFGSNTLYVFSDLHGGTPTAKANLNISSNVVVTSNVFISANLLVTGTANVTVNLNSVGIVSNNISINNNLTVTNTATLNTATAVTANITTANIVTLGVTGVGTAANLNVTNTANLNNANIASANITTLGVTGLSTLVNVSIGTGTSNVQANTTQLTIANPSSSATVNATTFTGTASNATNLNSQPGSFYTNATNITTGTLPFAQLPANAVFWSNTNTFTAIQTFNANVTVNAANRILVGNATVNATANQTTFFVVNATTNTSMSPGVITFGGGATINNTIYSGTANNANALGGYVANTTSPSDGFVLAYNLAENTIKWTNPAGITVALSSNTLTVNAQAQIGSNGSTYVATFTANATSTNTVIRSNNISLAVDSGSIQLNSNTLVSNSLLVSNTAANVIITTSQITIQNATTSSVITQNSFSRQANGATNLGPEGSGVTLSTIESYITSNSANVTTYLTTNSISIGGIKTHTANLALANNHLIAPTFKAYREFATTNTNVNANYTVDLSLGNIFNLTLNANPIALTFSNPPSSGTSFAFTLILRQDGTTGNRTVTYSSNCKFTDNVAPVLATATNKLDVLQFLTVDGGTTYFGAHAFANVG